MRWPLALVRKHDDGPRGGPAQVDVLRGIRHRRLGLRPDPAVAASRILAGTPHPHHVNDSRFRFSLKGGSQRPLARTQIDNDLLEFL